MTQISAQNIDPSVEKSILAKAQALRREGPMNYKIQDGKIIISESGEYKGVKVANLVGKLLEVITGHMLFEEKPREVVESTFRKTVKSLDLEGEVNLEYLISRAEECKNDVPYFLERLEDLKEQTSLFDLLGVIGVEFDATKRDVSSTRKDLRIGELAYIVREEIAPYLSPTGRKIKEIPKLSTLDLLPHPSLSDTSEPEEVLLALSDITEYLDRVKDSALYQNLCVSKNQEKFDGVSREFEKLGLIAGTVSESSFFELVANVPYGSIDSLAEDLREERTLTPFTRIYLERGHQLLEVAKKVQKRSFELSEAVEYLSKIIPEADEEPSEFFRKYASSPKGHLITNFEISELARQVRVLGNELASQDSRTLEDKVREQIEKLERISRPVEKLGISNLRTISTLALQLNQLYAFTGRDTDEFERQIQESWEYLIESTDEGKDLEEIKERLKEHRTKVHEFCQEISDVAYTPFRVSERKGEKWRDTISKVKTYLLSATKPQRFNMGHWAKGWKPRALDEAVAEDFEKINQKVNERYIEGIKKVESVLGFIQDVLYEVSEQYQSAETSKDIGKEPEISYPSIPVIQEERQSYLANETKKILAATGIAGISLLAVISSCIGIKYSGIKKELKQTQQQLEIEQDLEDSVETVAEILESGETDLDVVPVELPDGKGFYFVIEKKSGTYGVLSTELPEGQALIPEKIE